MYTKTNPRLEKHIDKLIKYHALSTDNKFETLTFSRSEANLEGAAPRFYKAHLQ